MLLLALKSMEQEFIETQPLLILHAARIGSKAHLELSEEKP